MHKYQILIILICTPLLAASQGVSGGVLFRYTHTISDRWRAATMVSTDYSHIDANFVWGKMGLGARFSVNEQIHICATSMYSYGRCVNTDNEDIVMCLTEGVYLKCKYNISHFLSFDQRILKYQPSGYENSSTRLSYIFAKQFRYENNSNNYHYVASHIVMNMRSDVKNTTIVQRFKVQYTFVHQMLNRNEIGIDYIYMIGGKRQTYLDESHNLHRIVLFFRLNN